MIENRNVNIITDADGKKLVLINDIRFALPVYEENVLVRYKSPRQAIRHAQRPVARLLIRIG